MENFLKSIPKKTIAGITTAITIYLYVKGYIGQDEVILIVGVATALGLSVEGALKAVDSRKNKDKTEQEGASKQ